MNNNENINKASQSAQLKNIDISRKSAKIRQPKKMASLTAIFLCFFSISVNSLLGRKL